MLIAEVSPYGRLAQAAAFLPLGRTEASRSLAQRVMRAEIEPEARLRSAFRLVVCRDPKPKELAVLLRRLKSTQDRFGRYAAEVDKLLAVGEAVPDKSLSRVELAAYTTVCSVIFNLDEALNRE